MTEKRTALIAEADERASQELFGIIQGLGLVPVAARTSAEVLSRMEKGADVVFLDLKSEELQGGQLLSTLREKYPSTPVVVCTNAGKKDDVIFALRLGCMDWMDKPADRGKVSDALKRVARETRRQAQVAAQTATTSQSSTLMKEITGRIKDGSIVLPEMPKVLDEMQRVLANLQVSPEEVLKILEKDPAMASKILATANTATYGGRGRINDLKSAVTRLGNRTIASIAQTAALRGLFQFRLPAFRQVFQRMWTAHCVSACLARELAAEAGDNDPEEIYVCALLHNAGEQFLLRVFAEIFQRQTNQVLSMEEVLAAIRDTHAVFGYGLLKKWNMGPLFEMAAQRHHEDAFEQADLDDRARRTLHILNVADRLVEDRNLGIYKGPSPGPPLSVSFEALGLSPARRAFFARRVEDLRVELAQL